jgi:hypothetical protein
MMDSGIYVFAIEQWQGNGKLLNDGLFQKQPRIQLEALYIYGRFWN